MLKRNNLLNPAVLLALLIPLFSMGQSDNSSNTSSPYSYYGFGNMSGYSFGRGVGMGGVSLGIRNGYQINIANPASYTAIDSMTFLMEFGVNSRHTSYTTENQKKGSNDVNFNHMTFSVPLTKWWATAFGLVPYSNKGYAISSTRETDYGISDYSFNGSGALSKVILGNGFKINENLSVGFNAWFMFGKLKDNIYVYYPYDDNAYDYLKDNSLTVHDVGITAGVQYQYKSKKDNTLIIGAIFEPKNTLSSDYTIHEERVLFRNSTQSQPIIDTLRHEESSSKGLRLPASFGAGFSYSLKNKITFGADFFHQKWDQALFLGDKQQYMTNSNRYSTGLEFTPDRFSIRSYLDRVQYRIGAFYENSYLTLNENQINGYGITFGLGLPISRSLSTLNFSAELGKLGTKDNNLIRETYAKFTLHVLLHDRWFIKRKFD